jgi:hypothetical protein
MRSAGLPDSDILTSQEVYGSLVREILDVAKLKSQQNRHVWRVLALDGSVPRQVVARFETV